MDSRVLGAGALVLALAGGGLVGAAVAAQEPTPPAPPAAVVAAPASPGPASAGLSGDPAAAASGGPGAARDGAPRDAARSSSREKSTAPKGALLPESEPVAVRVPRLDVSSQLVHLGLNPDGTMEVPQSADPVGWYDQSPTAGEQGPSVYAGHVTWDRKPAVFFRLGDVRPGDRVEVDRRDGRTAVFEVTKVAQYPKDEFPTSEVYANLDHAGIRLITCAGKFDADDRRYSDNIVVYGKMVDVRA